MSKTSRLRRTAFSYIYEDKIFTPKMFAIYKEAFANRQKSDYDLVYKANKDDILLMTNDVKKFISVIKQYIENSYL